MADSSISFGLDASEFLSGANAVDSAHERLIASSHRVATRVGHISDQFYKGGTAAGIFGQAIIATEQSLNLPLSSLGVLAGLGYFVSEVAKSIAETDKLKNAIRALTLEGSKGSRFETLEALTKQLD